MTEGELCGVLLEALTVGGSTEGKFLIIIMSKLYGVAAFTV